MTFFVELDGNDPNVSGLPPEPPPPEPEPRASVGQVLKERRLELGLKHKDIFRDTKIKADYLKAIEDEQFDLLPTPQYLRLFLKSYAEHLGLDVQEIYGLYDTREIPVKKPEKSELHPEKEVPPEPAISRPQVKGYGWMIGVGVVIVLVVVVFLIMAKRKAGPVESEPEPMPLGAVADTAPAGGEADIPVSPAPSTHQLEMRALDSIWMVIQADDDTVFSGSLGPGEVRAWTAKNVFRLSLSAYAQAEAKLDGQYLRPFTAWGRPIQGREVGAFNVDQYLDSSRLATEP